MLNPFWGDDWPLVRAAWDLDPDVVHLNHGSYGAVPIAAQAEQRRLRTLMERDPDRWFRELPERVAAARHAIADHCGADRDALALVPNASAGVTVALAALDAAPGTSIVYTDHGYGAVELAIGRTGLRPHRLDVPLDADDATVVGLIEDAVDGAAMVVVDQVTSATARRFPVREIAALCRRRGVPLLVDGAHAPGMLADPLAGLDADFWVGNLHKWTCAPRSTGALVASPRWRDRLRPPIASWWELEPYPARFDAQGTIDLTAWLAAPAALDVLAALGMERVRRHNGELVEHGQRLLCAALDVEPPKVAEPAPAMRLVPLPAGMGVTSLDCHALQARIADRAGCEVAITTWRGQGFLRLSAHVHNHPGDYATLAARLPAVLADVDSG